MADWKAKEVEKAVLNKKSKAREKELEETGDWRDYD